MIENSTLTAYVEMGDTLAEGTALERLAFCADGDPAVTEDVSVGTFVIRIIRDLVPADDEQIAELIACGDLSSRETAVEPMLAQLRATYLQSSSHAAPPFSLEPAWARTFGTIIAGVTGVTPSGSVLSRARLAQATRIVERHSSDRRLTPVALASALKISRRTLYDLTASSLGGISEYIRTVRVTEAIAMLANPEYDSLTMGEIASRAGFSSSKHLSRALAVLFDTSAGAVRRERYCPVPVRSDLARLHVP